MKVSDLIQLNEEKEILMTMFHHLNSQAKPNTPRCSPAHYRNLAEKCYKLKETIDKIVE